MTPHRSGATASASPFSIPNVNLFVRFRIFFNSRFYYPVFTIMFLDFGLTLEDFAVLNAIWEWSKDEPNGLFSFRFRFLF